MEATLSREWVRLTLEVADAALAERAAAEAYAAGAGGLEERDVAGGKRLLLYAQARLGEIEPVEPVDWSLAWRRGLAAVVVSPRLVVRPPFVEHALAPGQAEVVIDPGQAFGTGGHASTRLALELLDAAAPARLRGARVLDVGTGSGVLALAALRLGAARALGFDLDPLAAPAARDAALRNGLAAQLQLFTGPIAALRPAGFDLVVANLLRRELLPVLPALAAQLRPGGAAVLAGLLRQEAEGVCAACAEVGLRRVAERRLDDAGGDAWLGLLMER